MAAKKGRARKAPGKKERPECTSILRVQIDALVAGRLAQLAPVGSPGHIPRPGLTGGSNSDPRVLVDLVRDGSRRFSSDMLNDPAVIRATEELRAHLAGQITIELPPGVTAGFLPTSKNAAPLTPEQFAEFQRRLMASVEQAHQEGFVRRHRKDLARIARKFSVTLTDKQVEEILKAAWDWRCEKAYVEMRGAGVERDREYLRWAERRYNQALNCLLDLLHLPCQFGYRAAVEIGVALGVLDALRAESERASEWRKRVGFTRPHVLKKNRGEGLRQQLFWDDVIKRLVGLVNPLLGEKKGERWYVLPKAKERAYGVVSALLNDSYPGIGFTPARVKKRFLQSDYDYP